MKIDLSDFFLGFLAGAIVFLLFAAVSSNERYAIVIKAHQEGRIVCSNVVNELICREVRK